MEEETELEVEEETEVEVLGSVLQEYQVVLMVVE